MALVAVSATGFDNCPAIQAWGPVARFTNTSVGSLEVRQIVVRDASGVPRAMLGAPLPGPVMLGTRFRRRGDASGPMLYDCEGNERGGYVSGDSGRGAALTLDGINRAAVHLGVNERGETHLTMSNGQGHWSGFGITPRGSFQQSGSAGKVVFDAVDSARNAP